VEQPAQERRRVRLPDLALPRRHAEGALVLAARAVLWEEAGSVLPVGLDDDGTGCADMEHLPLRAHRPDQVTDVVDDPWVGAIAGDAQGAPPPERRDGAIAEVVAEKRRISTSRQRALVRAGGTAAGSGGGCGHVD